jgi:hypothetical protein
MNTRYLSFLIFFAFQGIISCNQTCLSFPVRHISAVSELIPSIYHENISGESKGKSQKVRLTEVIETHFIVVKDKETISEKTVQDFSPDMVIQVGAFLRESNALSLNERLSHLLNNTVVIVTEDGYFKVRIIGFKSLEEIEKLIPTLGLLGIKNFWVFRTKKEDTKSQVVALPDTSAKPIKDKVFKPEVIALTDTALKTGKDKINLPAVAEEKPSTEKLTVNLQVGIFHRRSEALRAQRRITAKLNLPVEIVREWEYYIVLITGFKTREEIFKYYPKLAALGYPDSFMIDDNVISRDKKTK